MRFLIAALLFILSLVALLVGIAQRTVWAPPANFSAHLSLDSTKPIIMVPHKILKQHPGKVTISVRGEDLTFIADGRESDIQAWLDVHEYDEVVRDKKTKELTTKVHLGVVNLDSPYDSDLWRNQNFAKSQTQLVVNPADEGAVLIASDGVKPAPKSINLIWPIKSDLFWSNVLMISGGVLLIGALIMNAIAYRHLRKSRGPRRRTPAPPKPPRYKVKRNKNNAPVRGRRAAGRAYIAIPSAITVLTLVTGCAGAAEPTASPSPSASASTEIKPPAALTEKQVERILADLEKVVASADEVSDKKLLVTRVTGPSLEQRDSHYVMRTRSKKVQALPAIVAKPIELQLPAATKQWPRTLMVVTDEPGDVALPQLLVMQQATPRSQYLLWYNIRLMPGAKIPKVPTADVGAIPVENDSVFLKISPMSLATAYGDVINKGAASLSYGLFDIESDEFYKQVSQSQKSQVENLDTGKITFGHSLGNKNVLSLATTDGGALVAVYMNDTYTIKPKKRGSAVAVSGQEKILLGADGSTRGIKSVYGDMLLFYVPALSDSSKVRLLGVSQGLVSVRSL
ncbi:MAG: hypothetical protein RLY13_385 [Actinomycetota bacterium]